jgi:transposase InsO family protein
LRRFGCILDAPSRRRRPLELAEPMTNIELDFTDVSSVPSEPLGKKQHGVESLNAIDAGTSTWLFTQVRADFNAETARFSVIELFSQYGCPKQLTFDRDPRWIGAQQMRTFPSAFVRMLLCLGITPSICPPRRPDKKPFVERLHRTLQEECLLLQHPQTPEAAQEVSEQFRQHYNQERPHQGKACRNVPRRLLFQPCLSCRHYPRASILMDGSLVRRGGVIRAR